MLSDVLTRMIAILAGAFALVLLVKEAAYLRKGYTIEVVCRESMPFSKEKGSRSVSEIPFPEWRKAATALFTIGLVLGLVLLLVFLQKASFFVLLITFVAALLIGYDDVTRYGTMAAPMSWTTLSLLAAVLIAVVRS
jgi:hypothetical protein